MRLESNLDEALALKYLLCLEVNIVHGCEVGRIRYHTKLNRGKSLAAK